VLALPVAAAAGYTALQWLGRTYGSTREEREIRLPGDEIWPWLVQMGWHRGGWYTARWVDRLLFPANRPSVRHIVPELQALAVGDFVPDGPPQSECLFVVERLEPAHALVLHSTSHLPPAWRRRFGAGIDWTWAFVLEPLGGGGRTRFLFRWRGRVHRGGWSPAAGARSSRPTSSCRGTCCAA
jgi:hypothetical protein